MRKIWMAIFCFALALISSRAYAVEETGIQEVLMQSQWGGYTLIAQDSDGNLSAGIVVSRTTGKRVFVIAQRRDGVFAITASYEKAIPPQWNAAGMQVEVHDAGDQYLFPSATLSAPGVVNETMQYVRFVQNKEGNWKLAAMQGELEGSAYYIAENPDDNTMTLIKHGVERGTVVSASTFDTTQPGFSFVQMVGLAKDEIEKDNARQRDVITARLIEAFPEESWVDADVVAWDMWEDAGEAATLAVVDRMRTRTVYFMDHFGGQKRNCRTDSLIPLAAAPDSLRVSIPYYFMEPEASHPTYLTYTVEEVEYSIEVERDEQNQCMVVSLSMLENEGTGYWIVTFGKDHMKIHPSAYARNGYLYGSYESYPSFPSLQSFDTNLAENMIRKVYSDYLAGSAPNIPDSADAYRMPQPFEAQLKAGVYDVYTGPGKEYFREAEGKARVSTKDWVQVFGRDGDWVLIQYRVKDALLRFGYIHQGAFVDVSKIPVLHFEAVKVLQDNQFVTSNPLGIGGEILLTGQEYSTTRLCTMGDIWMYVELILPNGMPARMFAEIMPSHG